jgi:ADP-ribose pyrophosphatase YjhB (NUDIX family)
MTSSPTQHTINNGAEYIVEYFDADSFETLSREMCKQAYGFAFHDDKFLIVNNILKPESYTPVGGSIEIGEHPNDALIREIKEESNMEVIEFKPIGYQIVTNTNKKEKPYYQLRYFCIVKPYGPFVSDPAGKVTEVIECDPLNYKQYFDWGEIGDRIMKRAIKFKKDYKK